MSEDSVDVQKMILAELREIKTEVRLIPKLQAQVDSMRGATQQLETAMRESTAALQLQSTAHGKLLDELRLQQHQVTAAMMGISNDLQSLIPRVRDLEKQATASFQQQQQLAKAVREAACFPDPEEYRRLKADVDTLPDLRADIVKLDVEIDQIDAEVKRHIPWLNGIEWFLRILFYLLAVAAAGGFLWLLGKALTNGL